KTVESVVQHCGHARRSAHRDPAWVLAWQQEVVAIEIDQLDTDTLQDSPDVWIPLGKDVIAMLHEPSGLDIGSGLSSQPLGTFEKNDAPVAKRQLPGNNHAGEAAAHNNGRRSSHHRYAPSMCTIS